MAQSADQELEVRTGETCRVGVRPPPFWPEEPALWFAQMEGQFILSNITADATKFYHVVAQLDHRYAKEVKDIISDPPAFNKYETLKKELINRFTASRQIRLNQLLRKEELGDRKPFQFLRHLRDLAGSDVSDEFLKTIWTGRLPTNIQTVVASQSEIKLESLSVIAVYEIAPMSALQAASTSATTNASYVTSAQFDEMARRISELSMQVTKLTSRQGPGDYTSAHYYPRSRSMSRSKREPILSRSRTPQPPSDQPYCLLFTLPLGLEQKDAGHPAAGYRKTPGAGGSSGQRLLNPNRPVIYFRSDDKNYVFNRYWI